MNIFSKVVICLLLFFYRVSQAETIVFNKSQIPYLMQAKEVEKSINLYFDYYETLGKHDFEILQQMALILLEHGAHSQDREIQLLSIYGCGVASVSSSLDVLEAGIKSNHAETQIASIQYLGRLQDDRSDELLVKAMSSEFFFARMEAAFHLASRKHRSSVGQIESLMYRIPPQARFFFPQFFALIGTSDAIAILRHLIEDTYASVRVESLLSCARFGRDDLLPSVRNCITHLNVAEQESACYAIGILKDSKSLNKLKLLLNSSSSNVKLAAAKALYLLGDLETKEIVFDAAKKGDLFAISILAEIPEGKDLLASLCKHSDLTIRLNAGISLIKHHDPRCIDVLLEIFLRDSRDMGFIPSLSLGKTMLAFKPLFSSGQRPKDTFFDVEGLSFSLRQQILEETIHLPEESFLKIANFIFESKQNELIPFLILSLENLQTSKSIALLKEKSEEAGAPLLRAYCNLSLFRMRQEGHYKERLNDWILRHKDSEMIRFRPLVPMDQRLINSPYDLTPEDSSRLLVDSYQTLADTHDESSVNLLLKVLRDGNPKNRFVLAGLLLRTLQ